MAIERALVAKIDEIVEKWLKKVEQDRQIASATGLNRQGLRDSIPTIIEAVTKNLADSNHKHSDLSEHKAYVHGVLRAQQNFDPDEIAREFFILRQVIISELKSELSCYSSLDTVDILASVNATLDYFISQSFKSYTEQKLQQLEQLKAQLLLTNQELTRLVEVHKNSFSYLTHEIKNPLTSILGYSDLVLRQSQQNSENINSNTSLRHIKQVLTQGRKILRLVNDSLEFISDRSKIELNCKTVEVGSLLDSLVLSLKALATAKDLQLSVVCHPRIVEFTTDPLRLQQICTNLITNAIRYTESGKIEVVCQTIETAGLKITVADTGIGIPQKYYSSIFEPYFRLKYREKYASESRGLGLAIVAQLVKMLQGKIWVDSEAGVGSTFTVFLPKIELD